MDKVRVIPIRVSQIERGIKKYEGVIDPHLSLLIEKAGMSYTPYLFADGRVLLVMPNESGAFLYPDRATVFQLLSLD